MPFAREQCVRARPAETVQPHRSSERPVWRDSSPVALAPLLLARLVVWVVRSVVTRLRNVRRPRTTFMYGIPKDLRLERLVGQEFNFIGLGRFQIQFHISSLVAIQVEGRWELRDASGVLVDSQQEHGARATYCLHCIIDVPITRFTIDAPRSLTLFFESGHSLSIFDDSEHYESFSVYFTGESSLYI